MDRGSGGLVMVVRSLLLGLQTRDMGRDAQAGRQREREDKAGKRRQTRTTSRPFRQPSERADRPGED